MIDKFRKIAAGCRIRELVIVLMGIGWVGSMLYKDWLNKQETLVCMVRGGTSYIGWADPVNEDKEFHKFITELALHAIFNRTPDGYSDWDIATRVLNTPVQNSLLKDLREKKDEAIAFRTMKITQSFVSYHMEETAVDSSTFTMMVKGNIQRDLIRDGEAKTETTPVRVMLRLIDNPNWDGKGRQAMVVSQLQVDPI